MLLKSKQRDKIIQLRSRLEQKGWVITEEIADVGNDVLRWGDVPGNILEYWMLKRDSRHNPLHLDFEAKDDGLGMVISKDDFLCCRLRESDHNKSWGFNKQWPENLEQILQSLDNIQAEQAHQADG